MKIVRSAPAAALVEEDLPAAPAPLAPLLQEWPVLLRLLHQVTQGKTYQAETLPQTLTQAQRCIGRAFGAPTVQCWLFQDCDAWHPVGEVDGPRALHTALRRTAQAACAQQRLHIVTHGRMDRVVAAIPLIAAEQQVGVLALARPKACRWSPSEQEQLHLLADQLAQVILADAVRAELQVLHAMHDTLDDLVILKNADGHVIAYNQMAKSLAANRGEILAAEQQGTCVPQPEWATSWPNGSSIADAQLPSSRIMQGQTDQVHCEMLLTPDPVGMSDHAIPLRVSVKPLRDARNDLIGTLIAAQDLSALKNAEHYKDFYMRRNVHDLRTPLTTIKFGMKFIERFTEDFRQGRMTFEQCAQEIAKWCDKSQHAVDRINADISKIVSTEINMGQLERMSLFTFVNDYLHRMRDDFGPLRIQWDLDAADADLEGYWNPQDIESIVSNLMNNALKYSPDDTLVYVQLFPRTIDHQRYAVLMVQDSGYGIPEDDLERIFEADVRSVAHMPGAIPGNGKGLHYCRELAKQYSGSLAAYSDGPQTGSLFTLRLPLANEHRSSAG